MSPPGSHSSQEQLLSAPPPSGPSDLGEHSTGRPSQTGPSSAGGQTGRRSMLSSLLRRSKPPPGPFPEGPRKDWDAEKESSAPHPKLVTEAADALSLFDRYTKPQPISKFCADSIHFRKAFQNSAFEARSALKAAKEVDPSLSRVCWTLEVEHGMDVGTARTAVKALEEYWANGKLEVGGIVVSVVTADEMDPYKA